MGKVNLEALHFSLKTKDYEKSIYIHTRHVIENALAISNKIGISEPYLTYVKDAAVLHDIGKYWRVNKEILGAEYKDEFASSSLHGVVGAKFLEKLPEYMIKKEVIDIVARHTSIPWNEKDVETIDDIIPIKDEELRKPIPNPFSGKVEFTYDGITYSAEAPDKNLQQAMLVVVLADCYDLKRVEDVIQRKKFLKGDAGKCMKRNIYASAKALGLEKDFAHFKPKGL